ncbi:MAG: YciI family protein [Candidatus Acidiferrales bacterium]|mgnify:CR=1 FL=1
MRYMLLIYSKETQMEQMSPEENDKITSAHWAVMEETAKRGIFRGAEPLKPTATATTVRVQGGKPLITDGPFAETKEQLAGYYILDCKDLDEAISWAAKIPTACRGGEGCIEIRPLVAIRQPAQTGAA